MEGIPLRLLGLLEHLRCKKSSSLKGVFHSGLVWIWQQKLNSEHLTVDNCTKDDPNDFCRMLMFISPLGPGPVFYPYLTVKNRLMMKDTIFILGQI